ncbi:hypothetical protein ACJ41O_014331 [Fusarium nematophilum]
MANEPCHNLVYSVTSGSNSKAMLGDDVVHRELQLEDSKRPRLDCVLETTIDERHGRAAEDQVTGYKTYKRRWFGLVQLMLLNLIVGWDWLTFAPVVSSAAAYYNTSEININWFSTACLFVFVAISPLAIRVLHWGPKPSIMAAASLVVVGNWVRYGGSHSREGGLYGIVMLGQILNGLAQPFVLAAPTRYSDLWFTDTGRVAATAATSLANPLGAALGQIIMPLMVTKAAEMSQGVLFVSIISTFCALPAYFMPAGPPTPVAPSTETPRLSLRASLQVTVRSPELCLILVPFAFYVACFSSASSLLNQVLKPYGFSDNEAGIGGGLLIIVGLFAAAITSHIVDRTKKFLLVIKFIIPLIAICYLVLIWIPETRSVHGAYVTLAMLGASSFSLVPVALEYLAELSHPISPEVMSVVAWSGGQLLGGGFILASKAMQADDLADPPRHMKNALIFQAVVALVVMPLPLCLGLFGRKEMVALRRVDEERARRTV